MNDTIKLFTIVVVSFGLGAATLFGWSRYRPIPSPIVRPDMGAMEVKLGYPSEGIPPLQVYAFNKNDPNDIYRIDTEINQTKVTFENLLVGEYYIVAYVKDSDQAAGGYTKAVACGLSVDCTDHSLVTVNVKVNEITTGIEVKDWYAPPGTFPAKPKG